jgi:NADH dehydrogenase
VLADVRHLDLDRKMVVAAAPDGRTLHLLYDTLVVAAGANHAYFGREEWAEFAPGMKTIEDARHLRSHVLSAFEMAELSTDPAERAQWLTFVVVGAGPTGVELVGQIAELAHQVLPRDYRTVDTTEARIILLEGMGAVLWPFHPKLQAYATDQLRKKGVDIRLNTLAVEMDHESVSVKGPDGEERIPTRTRIWAAGVQASPLAKLLADASDAQVDRAGRVSVNPDCSLPARPDVYAVGDMVSLNNLPGVAQPALQEGAYVGKAISARLRGADVDKPFKYFDKGTMATIGHKSAVAEAFGRRFTGYTAFLMWAFIHNLYLIGWGNRLGTPYTWLRGLAFARNRGHRLITFRQARTETRHDPAVVPAGSADSSADVAGPRVSPSTVHGSTGP